SARTPAPDTFSRSRSAPPEKYAGDGEPSPNRSSANAPPACPDRVPRGSRCLPGRLYPADAHLSADAPKPGSAASSTDGPPAVRSVPQNSVAVFVVLPVVV